MEQWKAIKGYEGLYEVSDGGKVRSLNYNHTGKVKELSLADDGRGYLHVNLCKEGKYKSFKVHRLVVEAFIGEIPKGLIVNHKDENKQNNNVNNIEICTVKYNLNYGTRNERVSAANKGKTHSPETRAKISAAKKGKNNPMYGKTPWNKGMKGKKHSPETCAKISATLKSKKRH